MSNKVKMKHQGKFRPEYIDWLEFPLFETIEEFKKKIESITGDMDKTVDELIIKGIKEDIKNREFWVKFGPKGTIQFYIADDVILSAKLSALVEADIDECEIGQAHYLKKLFEKQIKRLDRAIKEAR